MCKLAKSHKLHFHSSHEHATQPFHLLFLDLWIVPESTNTDVKSVLSIASDHSHFTWIFLLHCKNKTPSTFVHFQLMVEKQFEKKIKSIQTDGGLEFKHTFTFLTKSGIIHKVICPYTSEQNEVVKCYSALALLFTAYVPLSY